MSTTHTLTVEDIAARTDMEGWELRRGELPIMPPSNF